MTITKLLSRVEATAITIKRTRASRRITGPQPQLAKTENNQYKNNEDNKDNINNLNNQLH